MVLSKVSHVCLTRATVFAVQCENKSRFRQSRNIGSIINSIRNESHVNGKTNNTRGFLTRTTGSEGLPV